MTKKNTNCPQWRGHLSGDSRWPLTAASGKDFGNPAERTRRAWWPTRCGARALLKALMKHTARQLGLSLMRFDALGPTDSSTCPVLTRSSFGPGLLNQSPVYTGHPLPGSFPPMAARRFSDFARGTTDARV